MRLYIFALILFGLIGGSGLAQGLTGTVNDSETGEALPYVSVYLSNTTYAVETDTNGHYNLTGMGAGRYTLAVRVVGYTPYYQSVTLQNGINTQVNVRLKPDGRELAEVKVVAQRDKAWEKMYQNFLREFLGANASAKLCKIVNPWVLELEEKDNTLSAKASQIIEIENRYLGYKVLYDLRSFRFDGQQTFYSGLSSFQSLIANNATETAQWKNNRERVFQGSEIHFFKNLAEKKSTEAGYEAYLDKPGTDPSVRSRFFYQDQQKKLIRFELDSLVSQEKGAFRVLLPRRFELHSNGMEGAYSIYRDKLCQVAWIETTGRPLIFNEAGILLNPQEWSVSGYLANLRMAETLPINYKATQQAKTAKRSGDDWQEVPVFTTDQPYYRPGQRISIAGQMQYSNPVYRDSLSRLLRVELFSSSRQMVYTGRWIIQEGSFQGQIPLPDTLIEGMYLLRLYTQWMRNFGEISPAMHWVPLVGLSEKPLAVSSPIDTLGTLTISRQDSLYKWRLNTSSDLSLVFANMALLNEESTPLVYPKTLPQPKIISNNFPENITLPMERGINLVGKVTGKKDKVITDAQVLLVIPRLGLSFMSLTDTNGEFHFNELPIEGKHDILLNALNAKGKPFGNVQVTSQIVYADSPTVSPPDFPTEASLSPIQIVYDTAYSAKAIQLNEVAVKTKRTPPSPKIYKQADYVVQGKDLQNGLGTNFLVALQGRVPGLDIREVRDADGFFKLVVYIRGSSSAGFSTSAKNQPLIMVDGVPFEDINQVASISPTTVDRVEVVTRAEPMLGMRGYSGVISIFIKQDGGTDTDESGNENSLKLTLEGYTIPTYQAGASVLWLPNLSLDPIGTTEGRLPALPAGRYRLVVEGFGLQGQRVMASSLFRVE